MRPSPILEDSNKSHRDRSKKYICPYLLTEPRSSPSRIGQKSSKIVEKREKSFLNIDGLVFYPVQHVSWSFYRYTVEPQDFLFHLLSRQRSYGHPGRPVVPELSRSSKNRDFRCDQDFTRAKQHVTVSVDAPGARKAQDVSTGRKCCATRISRGQTDTSRSQFEPPRTEMRKPDPQIRDPTFSGLLETFASTGRPGTPYERCRDKR